MSALIGGKFKLGNNINFWQHLVALGVPEDKAKEEDAATPIVDVKVEGKVVTFTTETDGSKIVSQLIIDRAVDETVYDMKLKSTITKRQNELTVISKGPQGKTITRLYEFTISGLVVTLDSEDHKVPLAKRYYLRQY